jgi:hypothetical protein
MLPHIDLPHLVVLLAVGLGQRGSHEGKQHGSHHGTDGGGNPVDQVVLEGLFMKTANTKLDP